MMGREKSKPGESGPPVKPPQQNEITLKPSGEVEVTHAATPPRAPNGKQIHPRRPLPLVPEAPAEKSPVRPRADDADPEDEKPGARRP